MCCVVYLVGVTARIPHTPTTPVDQPCWVYYRFRWCSCCAGLVLVVVIRLYTCSRTSGTPVKSRMSLSEACVARTHNRQQYLPRFQPQKRNVSVPPRSRGAVPPVSLSLSLSPSFVRVPPCCPTLTIPISGSCVVVWPPSTHFPPPLSGIRTSCVAETQNMRCTPLAHTTHQGATRSDDKPSLESGYAYAHTYIHVVSMKREHRESYRLQVGEPRLSCIPPSGVFACVESTLKRKKRNVRIDESTRRISDIRRTQPAAALLLCRHGRPRRKVTVSPRTLRRSSKLFPFSSLIF